MKQKPIEIWWGVDTTRRGYKEGIRAEDPVPIYKKFLKEVSEKDSESNLSHCPAILDELRNVYGIKPYYDYELKIDSNNNITTEDYTQKFFDEHILVRKNRLVSFEANYVFFAPFEESLLISQVAPFLEDNEIANSTITIPGRFDIGKYFRAMDYAFIFKKKTSSIKFLRKQVFFYVRFHTTRPIVFRQFFWDKEINEYYSPMMAAKNHKYLKDPIDTLLSYYYKLFDKFQFKKKLIKIIEKNLTIER